MKKIKLVEHCNERQIGNKFFYKKENNKDINSRKPFASTYKMRKKFSKRIKDN